jgi:phage baseplate assembly protein V
MWIWFPEGQDSLIATMRRATVQSTDDSGTQQMLKKMTGMKTETFTNVYRPQMHGFSSVAPSGSEGVFLALGGRSDRLLALGFEHQQYRPKNTPEGDTVIYNQNGDVVRVFKAGMSLYHASQIKLSIGSGINQTDDQSVTITATKDAITLTDTSTVVSHPTEVVVAAPIVKLGGADASTPVGLCGGGCATKVFAE